jgi:HlyD family secretion protein
MRALQKRLLLWTPVIALLVIGLVFALAPRPVAVDLLTLAPGPMAETLDEEGEARLHDIFGVSAPVTGQLRRVEVHVGDAVQANLTVLAQIEPIDPTFLDLRSEAQAQAAIRAAESALKLADAEVEQALAEYEFAVAERRRARELVTHGTISVRESDSAERSYRSSAAALATAQAGQQVRKFELERARAQLLSPSERHVRDGGCDCLHLMAPVSGTVLRIVDASERVVNAGELLLEIGNPAELEIVADFLSTDAVRIEPGQRVIIERWGHDTLLEGRVRRVEPYGFTKVSALGVEEQRVNVIIDFTSPFDQWQRLGHGYQVEARVVLWETDGVISLPLTALFRDGDAWSVFVEEGGRAAMRRVEVGHRNGVRAEILAGLVAGERVVLHPSDRVAQGVRIAAR